MDIWSKLTPTDWGLILLVLVLSAVTVWALFMLFRAIVRAVIEGAERRAKAKTQGTMSRSTQRSAVSSKTTSPHTTATPLDEAHRQKTDLLAELSDTLSGDES